MTNISPTLAPLAAAIEQFTTRTTKYGATVTTLQEGWRLAVWEIITPGKYPERYTVIADATAGRATVIQEWLDASGDPADEDSDSGRYFESTTLTQMLAELDELGDEIYKDHVRRYPDA